MRKQFYNLAIEDVLEQLDSSFDGIGSKEAEFRRQKYGDNKLPESSPDNVLRIFLRQFQNSLIYVLLAAGAAVLAMGEIIDGLIIFFVIIFNAVMGSIQEGRAQNTLLALKKYLETDATVLRDGKEIIIPDREIVPGDIVVLREGEKVPADARVIFSHSLKTSEAALTGESDYKYKITESLSDSLLQTAEQKNMVFKGTAVVSGNGKVVVVSTGSETVVGKITQKIANINTDIPLKKDIQKLSHLIIAAAAGIIFIFLLLGFINGYSLKEMIITSVAIAVSVIPEGLPVVMTLVLATGVWRMSRQNVLVKNLQAVEALGQAEIIALDKTGTLTKNEMEIQKIYAAGKFFTVGGSGYDPKGEIFGENKVLDPLNHPELMLVGKSIGLCADARVFFSESAGMWQIAGDPTEAAMIVLAQKIGFHKDALESEMPKIAEIPFDYKKKFKATLNLGTKSNFLVAVGAPEVILKMLAKKTKDGKNSEEEKLKSVFLAMSADGLRVIAVAAGFAAGKTLFSEKLPPLSFVAFLGMRDVLREEAKEAIKKTRSAGIETLMITGDHEVTARSIAREVGIFQGDCGVIKGEQIDELSDADLANRLNDVNVFARVSPEHKLRIIEAYRKKGKVVAMTGDGVNDALSLAAADLGVSMGKIGTEVAKESADIILLDDNFGNIVAGVEEGRNIYISIKRVILYLFSTSVGEVLTILGAILLGYPLPILAAQIIWLNLVTDGFLDIALAMEPKSKRLIKNKIFSGKRWLVDNLMAKRVLIMAIPMAVATLYLFSFHYQDNIQKAWTVSLTTLAVFQWFNAWNCRSENKSIFQMNPLENKFLIGATFIVVFLQLAAVYFPPLQKILRTVPLAFSDWLMIIPIALSIVFVEEVRKFFYRKFKSN